MAEQISPSLSSLSLTPEQSAYAQLMLIVATAYPQFYKDKSERETMAAVNLWAEMFKDDDYMLVSAAVKAFIATDTKGFPPSIGQIKNKIADLKRDREMSDYEAWHIVKTAVSNGIYGSKEEFEKLPPILRAVVGSPNMLYQWAQMNSETLESVVGSNFMRSYHARVLHSREDIMLPSDVKKFMSSLAERMKTPELPQELTEQEVGERRNDIRKQHEEA